jgi:hypothetical protein
MSGEAATRENVVKHGRSVQRELRVHRHFYDRRVVDRLTIIARQAAWIGNEAERRGDAGQHEAHYLAAVSAQLIELLRDLIDGRYAPEPTEMLDSAVESFTQALYDFDRGER